MSHKTSNANEWDQRSSRPGLHAVLTTRWSEAECEKVNLRQQQAILNILPLLIGKKVLDFGCGIGRMLGCLIERGATTYGVDISQGMLARASEAHPSALLSHIQPATPLPFQDEMFDVVLASWVMQHIIDDELFAQTLKDLARTVKVGGSIVFVDGLSDSRRVPTNSYVTVVRTLGDYSQVLEPAFNCGETRKLLCIDDPYWIMRWDKVSK